MQKIDFKALFEEIRKRNPHTPNSNELHGYNFEWGKLFNAFLENSKGQKFELWNVREYQKGENGEGERVCEVCAYELKPLYQGGYTLKPIKWHFSSENEALLSLGKMKLFQQLEKSSCGYHRFTSEACRYFTKKHYESETPKSCAQKEPIQTIEFIDDSAEMPF